MNSRPTVGQLALHLKAELHRGDPKAPIVEVQDSASAGAEQISFIEASARLESLSASTGAILTSPELAPKVAAATPPETALLVVPRPRLAFAQAAQWLLPALAPAPGIDPRAAVHDEATVHPSACVEAFAVVKAGAEVGPRVRIASGAHVHRDATIGADSVLEDHAVVASGCRVGRRCRLGPGAVVGSEGFGYVAEPAEDGSIHHWPLPQQGVARLEDDVRLGAHVCVDRATFGETVVGQGTKVDNLVQVGHNVRVGQGCLLVAQSGVAGSAELKDGVVLAAQAGVAGHLSVGHGAIVGPQSGVMRPVSPGSEVMGTPAVAKQQFFREVAMRGRWRELWRRFRSLRPPNP